jgi:hypothetical protein
MITASGRQGGDDVAVDPAELAVEQEYFDRAAVELEKFLANLSTAPAAAGNTKAGRALKQHAEGARHLLDGQDPVAFGRFVDGDGPGTSASDR